jgi:hypothetical protein
VLHLQLTIALGDVVEFEILPPRTAALLCTKDKYNLPMFSDVFKLKQKPNSELNAHWASISHHIAKRFVEQNPTGKLP